MSNEKNTSVRFYVASAQRPASIAALVEATGDLGIRAIGASGPTGFAVVLRTASGSAAFALENVGQLRDLRRLIADIAAGVRVDSVALGSLDDTELAEITRELALLASQGAGA